jgi:hypothetical protein
VEGGICRAREEQCAGVKLIDVELGPDGGRSELSASVGFGPSSWQSGSTRGFSFV